MISRGRGSANEGGKTGRSANGAYEVAGSVAMRCAMPLRPSLLRRSPVPILEIAPGVTPGMVSPDTKECAGNPNGSPARGHFPCVV
jgi:hypothetical protein